MRHHAKILIVVCRIINCLCDEECKILEQSFQAAWKSLPEDLQWRVFSEDPDVDDVNIIVITPV